LEITYSDAKTDDILDTTSESSSLTEIKFISENYMNTDGFWSGASAIFTIIMVIIVLISGVQTYYQQQRGKLKVDQQMDSMAALVNMIATFIDNFASILFWLMVGLTGWWFVFYKL